MSPGKRNKGGKTSDNFGVGQESLPSHSVGTQADSRAHALKEAGTDQVGMGVRGSTGETAAQGDSPRLFREAFLWAPGRALGQGWVS